MSKRWLSQGRVEAGNKILSPLLVIAMLLFLVAGAIVLPQTTSSPPPAFAVINTADTYYVNNATGSDVTGDGSAGNPWKTIQHAVYNATVGPSDTIMVQDGTYNENVHVNKTHLTIQSENGTANCIVDSASGHHVFNVTESWVNITGFTVQGVTAGDAGIFLDNVQHCNISANNAHGSEQWYGIYLSYSNNTIIANNTCTENYYYGIYLYHSHNNTITNNTCTNNDDGIRLESSHNNTIANNTCNDNEYEGIHLSNSDNNTIRDNIVSGNLEISCPFVYSWDGQEYRLDSNLFGASTRQAMEGTDYSNLDYLTPADGEYLLKVTEELDETGYINELKLIVVDHPSGTQVVPDSQGNIHTIRAPYAPTAGVEEDGTDCLDQVVATDGIYWTSNLTNKDFSQEQDLRDGIILTFAKPEDAQIAKVVVDFKNTELINYMAITLLKLRGEQLDDWYAELNPTLSELEGEVLTLLYWLHLQVWNGTEWVSAGIFTSPGPWAERDVMICIDVSGIEGDTLTIKLESLTGLVLVDSVKVDYAADEAVITHELSAATAVDANGSDVTAQILSDDDDYLVLEQGDYAYLSFDEIPASPGYDRSYIVKAKGYYQSSIAAEGAAQDELLEKLSTDFSYAARYYLERYAPANGHCGIYLADSNNNTIINNTCNENYEAGIWLSNSHNNTVTNNTCNDNKATIWGEGIGLSNSDNNTITNNTCNSNDYDGIYLYESDNNTIESNTCDANGHGIYLEYSDNNTIWFNNITNNTWLDSGVHVDYGCEGNHVNYNDIVGNYDHGVYNHPANPPLDAVQNWWGNVSGPGPVGPGRPGGGDNVSANVNYTPWIGVPSAGYQLPYNSTVIDGTGELIGPPGSNTIVNITTTANVTVAVMLYADNPYPDEPYPGTALGKFLDIQVSDPSNVTWPVYVQVGYTDEEVAAAGVPEGSLGLYYYTSSWHLCSDTGVNTTANYIWANVNVTEAARCPADRDADWPRHRQCNP